MAESADGDDRTVPVTPPIHVETFATHATLTWKRGPLSRFYRTVRRLDPVPTDAPVVVDATDVAGRQRQPLSAFDPTDRPESYTYLRVEPPTSWTLSWERRTEPTVSLSGTPKPAVCRAVYFGTTGRSEWSDDATAALCRMLDPVL